ncbi:MAG TPA: CheR family methyltransferase, partial [Turneriella sp.]|nr:CheR family methyltransferase [Turneriella sp.]
MSALGLFSQIPELTDVVWQRLSAFIEKELGIRMPIGKKSFLQNRLWRRIKHYGFKTFDEYCDFLFSDKGKVMERTSFFNEITTNKTFFFREYRHFEFLSDRILPEYVANFTHAHTRLRVWSAACSTGEEIYSIACIIEEYMRAENVVIPYEIVGSDISTRVLWHAQCGVYEEEQIRMISPDILRRYFYAGKGDKAHLRRVKPEIRSRIKLRKINLMNDAYPHTNQFDVIFCRNALIYFSPEDISQIVTRATHYLKPGGYFIIGHADAIYDASTKLR